MEENVTVIVTNESGWQKPYQLGAGVHWIGTAEDTLIRLQEAEGLAAYHIQVVNTPSEEYIRLINLSIEDILIEMNGESLVFSPGKLVDISDSARLHVGQLTIAFQVNKPHIERQAVLEQVQRRMGMRLVLSDNILRPGGCLVGHLSLQNLGSEACQFEVALEGLPEESYEISPPPLISIGGEESCDIRIFHRGFTPPAGRQLIRLYISAPEVYPGETITIEQNIKVLPYYRQSLSFEPPEPPEVKQPGYAAPGIGPAVPAAEPVLAAPSSPVEPEPAPIPVEALAIEPAETPQPGLAAGTAAGKSTRLDLSSVKVMKATTGDFLEKKG